MKKVLTLMVAATLLFTTACDKDETDKGEQQQAACLLTKATYVNDNGDNDIEIYTYDGNKRVVKITYGDGDNDRVTIEYGSNGKISQFLGYWEYNSEVEEERGVFTYADNTMTILYAEKESGSWVNYNKTVYYLDSEGKVTREVWYDNENGNDNWTEFGTDTYTWSNGNITKIETQYSDNKKTISKTKIFKTRLQSIGLKSVRNVNETRISTFEYDNKNNAMSSFNVFGNTSKNNVTKKVSTYNGGSYDYTYNYTYEYNDKDFPTKKTARQDGNDDRVTLYEYNCN